MIGEMRDRVTIRRKVRTEDGSGGYTTADQNLYVRWAKVEQLTGREYFHAGQVSSDHTHRVTMRAGLDVVLSDKLILSDGKTLEIDSIRDIDGRGRYIEIVCAEVKP